MGRDLTDAITVAGEVRREQEKMDRKERRRQEIAKQKAKKKGKDMTRISISTVGTNQTVVDSLDSETTEFFESMETVWEKLHNMEAKISELDKIHSEILSALRAEPQKREQAEQLMSEIRKIATAIRVQLKMLDHEIRQCKQKAGDDTYIASIRMRETQHLCLTHKFTEVMEQYSITESNYREKCKDRLKRQLHITGYPMSEEQMEDYVDGKQIAIFTGNLMAERTEAKQQLKEIVARHDEIIAVEKSVREMRDLFLDMMNMVEAQGETVTRIEHHVLATKDFTTKGVVETGVALKYQSKARRKKIYLLIFIAIVVFIIIVVLIIYVGPTGEE